MRRRREGQAKIRRKLDYARRHQQQSSCPKRPAQPLRSAPFTSWDCPAAAGRSLGGRAAFEGVLAREHSVLEAGSSACTAERRTATGARRNEVRVGE